MKKPFRKFPKFHKKTRVFECLFKKVADLLKCTETNNIDYP